MYRLLFLFRSEINMVFASLAILLTFSCNSNNEAKKTNNATPLFTLLTADKTNITFNNTLTENLNLNVLMYEYFYNGGGVAIGDINNDGLDDIYFTANILDNQLYLNKGNMQFQDITTNAEVKGRAGPWKTGVTMVDINGDNKLDIYLSYSGKISGEKRIPQLFINQGNDENNIPRFKDETKKYGLADSSYCTNTIFFDYDKDGDLDILRLNHNPKRLSGLDSAKIKSLLNEKSTQFGTTLLKNDNGFFKDVTIASGIQNTVLSYNLGGGISDINNDGWPDIYLSNDYLVPDYLYINNGDGTFSNQLSKAIEHTSLYSMGNDIADVNNDGRPDIFTLDMLPEDNRRQKLLFSPDNYEEFDMIRNVGFHDQYMRNMLQLNNGDNTFSEIGQFSGVSNTDWSWAALFADFDNDGWKDLYVTNGYVRDYTNMDFLKYMGDKLQNRQVMRQDLFDLVQKIPASNVTNYMFKNNENLTFSNATNSWGFNTPSNSTGAAYADLDNDGDLDLVINNINAPAFIYRNDVNIKDSSHYLKINLNGKDKNTAGIGAKIKIITGKTMQYLEQMPYRGFQSSVSPTLHFGLGKRNNIDTLQIIWPSGMQEIRTNIKADQILVLNESEANTPHHNINSSGLYTEVESILKYEHNQNHINDFKRQPLLTNPLSFTGPCIVKSDVNNDGLDDIFIGASAGKPAAIFLQNKKGEFTYTEQPAFAETNLHEDIDAVFFDANGDGINDLYIAKGGYHNYTPKDRLLQDQLYYNDGKGHFTLASNALPSMLTSKGCVRVADVNGDGFPDIFVGGRNIPGNYPQTPASFLLINGGKGGFKDMISTIAPSLQYSGMITNAVWIDINNDGQKDLITVGEWMPINVYINNKGKLEKQTEKYFDKNYTGWWNTLAVGDFNKDGKMDLVAGNMGLNAQFRASDAEPVELYYKDFDENGSIDPILCFYNQHKTYPYVFRDELLDQMSMMRIRFSDYQSYADATLKDIFTPAELEKVQHLQVNHLRTSYFESGPDNKFHLKLLPEEVQFSPVFTITPLDFNGDGNEDVLFCGNIHKARLRFGNYDANHGILLQGDGNGNFTYVNQSQSGFHILGDVRSVVPMGDKLLFGINQQGVKMYKRK